MFCSKCGNQISENDKYCPNCGSINNEVTEGIKMATVIFERQKAAYFMACKYEVYLDGSIWGILKNGDVLNIELPCGNHQISVIDKNNSNRTVLSETFTLKPEGLKYSFSAKLNPEFVKTIVDASRVDESYSANLQTPVIHNHSHSATNPATNGRRCKKCGGIMTIQTVSESKKTGCGTIVFYILLAVTILGILIVIPLLLRNKSKTTTYAVCQNCGYKMKI